MNKAHTNGDTSMTEAQARSVRNEIAKCAAFIEKEEARSDDLRPQEMVDLLAFYKKHKAKLEGVVA